MSQQSIAGRLNNHLLRALTAEDFVRLERHLESVPLVLHQTIEEPHRPIQYVYFVEDGLMSVVASAGKEHKIEIGLIGWEGMSGIPIVMGDDRSPHHNFVQIAGRAQRIGSDDLREVMNNSASIQRYFLRFTKAFMSQTAQTALAHGRAKIEVRLAHWFLMAHDRSRNDEIHLTHEFLALMLGVRRSGVTIALNRLVALGLTSSARSVVSVLDRKGLEKIAGELYGVPEAEYQRLIGWSPTKH